MFYEISAMHRLFLLPQTPDAIGPSSLNLLDQHNMKKCRKIFLSAEN